MRMNNIATGIAIAVGGAAIIALGMAFTGYGYKKDAERAAQQAALTEEVRQPGTQISKIVPGRGDINGDGAVNTTDLTDLAVYISGSGSFTVNSDNSDMNGDGTINRDDYNLLKELFKRGVEVG